MNATGGGPNNVLSISPIEDSIAKITGMYTIVNGVEGTSFGVNDIDGVQELETPANVESVSSAEPPEPFSLPPPSLPPSKPRKANKSLESYMTDQKAAFANIVSALEKSTKATKEANYNSKRMYRTLERIHDALAIKHEEDKRHNLEVEKLLAEKNEIKRRRLEIEELKFEMENNNDELTN